jgi:two-component system NtrC family sensor kinase
MNNSLDFIQPEKGKITISINHDNNQKKSDKYIIVFEDNGPGISGENRNQIFTPFFTTKDSTKGTGLGLFIAKNILSHHNGTIVLDQNHKGGARFIIELEAYNG